MSVSVRSRARTGAQAAGQAGPASVSLSAGNVFHPSAAFAWDQPQLYHANCSVILGSSAINFSGDNRLDKFIANGILESMVPDNTRLVLTIRYEENL